MAKLLLLTNTFGGSSEVLPALGLLSHQVRILPAEASILIDAPAGDVIFLDARRELTHAKSLAKLLASTGLGAPLILIVTERGLTAVRADWGNILRNILVASLLEPNFSKKYGDMTTLAVLAPLMFISDASVRN